MTTFTRQITARNDQQMSVDDLIAAVFEKAGNKWADEARGIVYKICKDKKEFNLDDVAYAVDGIEPKPKDNRCIAQVMQNAKKNFWCRQTGTEKSQRKSRHYGTIAKYESLIYDTDR